ncbi:ATP-binding cassette domain-containing protein [Cohnella herbarum]|uniref:ATP-binding cassette domain-containing protein n=1 Tax=Cohnella herbarum TaxID=2728023 RepID=A0A7Z2VHH0_9BACL|nr:ATP-binding cassette domain-containing protein [Cohnella herbarum]QJD83291.1 ATP-binding cassette domain-containing protein [Cohnella herbarum]
MESGKRQNERQTQRDKPSSHPLRIDGLPWRLGEETEEAYRTAGLTLEPGTITLLMGPNGAGKSTLLEKLAGIRPPEEIRATYGNDALWKQKRSGGIKLNERALLHYSYACQSPEEGLFARSVSEEIDYSLRPYRVTEEERERRKAAALESVDWDSEWLERDPYRMSGGERRRAALAAVFATPAAWLLLDEPTAGLDGAGHETVARELRALTSAGKGILLVSHDSDWALPLADQVLLLSAEGTVRLCGADQLIQHPEWLEETGMKVPGWLRMVQLVGRSGVPTTRLWNPKAAAAAWHPAEGSEGDREAKLGTIPKAEKRRHSGNGRVKYRLSGFDPRSVWLAYILVSVGLFQSKDWFGALLGAVVVTALLTAGRVSLRRWRGLIVNYSLFSVITSAIFAWGASSESFIEWGAFSDTIFTFARTMLIMLLGLTIPLVMSPLSLRRSLEQMTSINGKTPAWAQRGILTVALIMRFVPVLLELWERFMKIFRARGKSISRNPVAMGRRLRDVSIPFLLALFRLGDEVALALESRGVGGRTTPTRALRLKWRLRDYGLAAGALALAIGLWGFSNR